MRVAYSLIFKSTLKYRPITVFAGLFLTWANNPCYAQLPPTNMGQFVHQPGDNQYTNQTQSERHGAPMPASMPAPAFNAGATANAGYAPTPAAPKPDVSLLPVVADEPIKPAGFPPLPDRLDLPTASAGIWTSSNGGSANGGTGSGTGMVLGSGISRDPQGVHQHYTHYEPGAFMPNQPVQQNTYRPSSSDYYNINPNAKAGMTSASAAPAPPVDTPSMQALKKMGAEPQLAADKVSRPEAPEAVSVNQSVSQDLSLPEDDFNKHYPAAINNSTTGRTSRGVGRALVYPARMVLYSGAGMAAGAAMYAVRR